MVELLKKDDKKDKKKKFWSQKQEHTREQKEQTLATSINIINVSKKRKKSVILVKLHISIAIRKAILPVIILSQKTSINLGNLHADDW